MVEMAALSAGEACIENERTSECKSAIHKGEIGPGSHNRREPLQVDLLIEPNTKQTYIRESASKTMQRFCRPTNPETVCSRTN